MSAPVGSIPSTDFDLLLSEANLGRVFLEDAALTQQPDRRWRCVQNARRALEALQRKEGELSLTAEQIEALNRVAAELEQGLRNLASDQD